MVRINIINPKFLTDQHLVAEFNEILMLLGYVKKYPEKRECGEKYLLGKGHIIFFKNKLKYLKKRHELIRNEMLLRRFKPRTKIILREFDKTLIKDWSPKESDKEIIKKRLIEKITLKPKYYRYYKEKKSTKFLVGLINKS